jgi:hypothetical protein
MRTEPAITNPQWLVVFCDPEDAGPGQPLALRLVGGLLRALLKPGFRHVYALRPLHTVEGQWLYVNHSLTCLDLFELPQEFANGIRGEVVRVAARRPISWVPRLVPTCVTTVAHLLGVPSRPWTTPYALYRHLTQEDPAMGAKKPDTSAADAAARKAQEEAAAAKAANEAKLRNLKAGRSGRSLLTFAATGETGVGKTTLGAG